MEKKERKFRWQEWLLSLGITLVLLGGVVAFQFWLTDTVRKTLDTGAMWTGNLIGDAVGGVILLLIVHHFVKKPQDER